MNTEEAEAKRAGEPEDKEARSRRLQSLLKPSIYQAIKEIADSRGRSVNNLLEMILIDFIAKENETKQAMNTMNTMNTEEKNCIDEYRRANIKHDIERKLRAERNFDICHKAYTATEQLLTYTDTTLRGMEYDAPDYMIYRNAHADLHDLYTIERENLRRATEELEDAKNALANWGKDAAIIEAEEAGKAGDHGQE